MQILINNEQDHYEIAAYCKLIGEAFQTVARLEKLGKREEVSISFVDNGTIQTLNKQYRGMDQPTDVLSFPQDELPAELPQILGDIVISLERAAEQAQEYGHSLEREVLFLAIHGLLHLLGYDHQTEQEEKQMRAREEEILVKLGLGR